MAPRKTPRHWYGTLPVPPTARILSKVFGGVSAARRKGYRKGWLKSQAVNVPVIVVGNITAGGTGKTPTTIAIVQRLLAEGFKPGVASRGYGRANPKNAVTVTTDTPIAESGDEAAMIFAATGVPVALNVDRVAAAKTLVAAGCDVIVCDDGLQHYALKRDIEIEVIDAQRRYGNMELMPAGPLREPASRADGIEFRILNWATDKPSQRVRGLWEMTYDFDQVRNVANGRVRSFASFIEQRVHAVAGIGNPERFFEFLRAQGMLIIPHAFPDHHMYTAADLVFDKKLPILMTEKDAIKCKAFADSNFYCVPVHATLPDAFWDALLTRVRTVAEEKVSG